jgi:peptidyl-prolyl cis-trans isomerase A (cyclophilin A)
MSAPIDRRTVLAGGLALASGRALAQDDAGLKRVVMKTGQGLVTLELEAAKAPITTRNFLRYVDARLLDGSSFYRVSHAPNAPDFGLIEGGLRGRKAYKPIAHESTIKTGLTHKDGVISMARLAPGTATADFFIVIGDHPGFDADPAGEGDNQGFAAFGRVVEGMEVVHAIFTQKVSPTAGVGPMKGEMLSPPVAIVSVRRT